MKASLLALAAVVALGLSAGAMLTEAVVLVSYWRSLPAHDFLGWFHDNQPRLNAFYGPLEIATAVLAIAAAGHAFGRRRAGAGLLAASAVLSVGVLALYLLYFRDANASFATGALAEDRVAAELARWASWQWIRTGVGVAAFVAALAAVRGRGG